MSIDINAPNPKVIPAVEAKEYSLYFLQDFRAVASTPDSIRVYARHVPYRRIYGQVEVTPAQPIVNVVTGEPVLDADGNPTFTEPVYETRVIGREFAPQEKLKDGDVKVIEIENICPMTDPDPAQAALIEQTLGAFVAQGGNVGALAMIALTEAMRQIGIQQGKFAAE